MNKAKNSTWLLLICLLIGQLYVCCNGSPIEPGDNDYQGDEYEYETGDDVDDDADTDLTKDFDSKYAPPYFETTDLRIDAKPGDDVVLNCDARNFQLNNAVMWYKKSVIIANGQNPISQRVEGMKNNSLLLRNVTPEDSDDYYCEILPQKVQQHTALRVGARLSILCDGREATDRSQTFKQGDSHKLECRTYLPGNITIKWSFNDLSGQPSTVEHDNGVILLDDVDEKNAGDYQCLADDGSRHPPHGTVHIDVRYSPIVSTHRHHVNTEANATAELYCNYRAKPIGRSYFTKDGKTLQISEKYSIKDSVHHDHNRTTLIVREVTDSDLGEYKCEVRNAIGSNEVKVHVSYDPEIPQFEDETIDGNKVTQHWLVRSRQALSEAMLDYQLFGSERWNTVAMLQTRRHNNTGHIWKITHQMELNAGTWNVRVRTKNTHGWSPFSTKHIFEVRDGYTKDASSEPEQPSDMDLPPDQIMQAGIGPVGRGAASAIRQLNWMWTLLAALLLLLRIRL
ncbi:protein turtle homolog A [Drosophila elegans]|uniref:protein turtle homolog A n=1 Tax=Drosophila elegans TaxID=30023 RepID=UPI0007E7C654|nr:protein turtle homolog A [Drosophila elegans]XP_017110507.1 protein turtle homolog A [Drosophila elegans]